MDWDAMTAVEKITQYSALVGAEIARLRPQYPSLASGAELMRETGARSIEDALARKAKGNVNQRLGWTEQENNADGPEDSPRQ